MGGCVCISIHDMDLLFIPGIEISFLDMWRAIYTASKLLLKWTLKRHRKDQWICMFQKCFLIYIKTEWLSIILRTWCTENCVMPKSLPDDNQKLSFHYVIYREPIQLAVTKLQNSGSKCHSINKQNLGSGIESKTMRKKRGRGNLFLDLRDEYFLITRLKQKIQFFKNLYFKSIYSPNKAWLLF